jgi:hypothetical protein
LREELAESRQLVETLRLEVHQKENIARLAVDSSSQQVSRDDTAPNPTLMKKKRTFASYIRKFRWDRATKSYIRKGFLIFEEMRKIFNHTV